mmetsp:Transcript_93203/g.194619  ORF Transcript_93203/g.194619 Transcript_93203/m.194619 type:complete len:103 (+) Transcript_93203:117-425(+)
MEHDSLKMCSYQALYRAWSVTLPTPPLKIKKMGCLVERNFENHQRWAERMSAAAREMQVICARLNECQQQQRGKCKSSAPGRAERMSATAARQMWVIAAPTS